jgi:hypothetical protein
MFFYISFWWGLLPGSTLSPLGAPMIFTKYYSNHQKKKKETVGACGMWRVWGRKE